MTRNRKLLIASAALIALPVIGYAVFALQIDNAPAPAALRAPAAKPPSGPAGPVDGGWAVSPAKEDFVGYRVREKLGPLPAPDDAVGRTRVVRGRLQISHQTITSASIIADLSTLRSDAPPRDETLRNEGLETNTFPRARFHLSRPLALGDIRRGSVVKQTAAGMLTLHGVTRPVPVQMSMRWNGPTIELAGSTELRLADFKMRIAQRLGLRIADRGTLEFELTLVRPAKARAVEAPAEDPVTAPDTSLPASRQQLAREPVSHVRGRQLAVIAGPPDDVTDSYLLGSDGSGARRLTHQPHDGNASLILGLAAAQDGFVVARQISPPDADPLPTRLYGIARGRSDLRPLTPPAVSSETPALSPGGDRIAFARPSGGGTRLFVADANGSGARPLPKVGAADDAPTWSPDGKQVAFTCFTSSEDICVTDVSRGRAHRLTSGPAYDSRPSWAPDGKTIAFARDGDIWTMDVGGGSLRRLTAGNRLRDSAPAWSPDGRWLAFIRADTKPNSTFTGPGRLMLIKPDGRGLRRVPAHLGSIQYVVWVP